MRRGAGEGNRVRAVGRVMKVSQVRQVRKVRWVRKVKKVRVVRDQGARRVLELTEGRHPPVPLIQPISALGALLLWQIGNLAIWQFGALAN